MKKTLILLFFLILAPVVFSEGDFFLSITPEKASMTQGESAKFLLSVHNNQSFSDDYQIYTKATEWTLRADPLPDYTTNFHAPLKDYATTDLYITPSYSVSPGKAIGVQIILKSKITGKEETANLAIDVFPGKKVYPSSVTTKINADSLIDPRKKLSIRVVLKNNNPADLSNLELSLRSKTISREIQIALAPNEEKVADFTFDLDKMSAPGKDLLIAELKKDGKSISKDSFEFEIIEYSSPFKKSVTELKKFLLKKTTITLENDGNVVKEQEISHYISPYARLFTKTSEHASYDRKNGFVWTIILRSGESKEIVVTTDYLPMMYLSIAVLLYIVLYFAFRSPIVMKKEIGEVVESEGGISEMRITVKIKNRSSKEIKNLKLIERIPTVASLVKEKEMVPPAKAYGYHEDHVLEWHFPEIEGKEERIIAYKIKTRLVVMGNFRLKPSIARFGKKKSFSNPAYAYAP